MGFSAKPMIIVGITADEIIKLDVKTDTYEKYDVRGNKTGQIGTDTKITIHATVNDISKTEDASNEIYCYEIASLLEIIDSPNLGHFGVFDMIYEGTHTLETHVIGIPIAKIDVTNGDLFEEVDPITLSDAIRGVKLECNEKFGIDVEPRLFLYGNASY